MKTCNQCGSYFYAHEDWKKICFDCWKRNKSVAPSDSAKLAIEPDLLVKLIYLSHPDKHGQSALSCTVSQTLLGLKNSLAPQ